MSPTLILKVVDGPHVGQELVCTDRGIVTIGRSKDCTLCLCGEWPDMLVSRRHCQIEMLWNGVEIRDLESVNGTFVNGRRIGHAREGEAPIVAASKLPLEDGDYIRIGDSLIHVSLAAAPADKSDCPLVNGAAV